MDGNRVSKQEPSIRAEQSPSGHPPSAPQRRHTPDFEDPKRISKIFQCRAGNARLQRFGAGGRNPLFLPEALGFATNDGDKHKINFP